MMEGKKNIITAGMPLLARIREDASLIKQSLFM